MCRGAHATAMRIDSLKDEGDGLGKNLQTLSLCDGMIGERQRGQGDAEASWLAEG